MMRRLDFSKKVALGAMVCALTVLCLYAASVLPTGRAACCFLSSVFVYALLCERAYGFALLCFAASAGLTLLIAPAGSRAPLIAYVVLLGHYGIFKVLCEDKIRDRVLRVLLKLVYCNFFVGISALLAAYVLDFSVLSLLLGWSIWVLVLLEQAVFLAYDLLYTCYAKIYLAKIRNSILPRR